MKILLSNDDGYNAAGLLCLHEFLNDLGDIIVVAPDRNKSGASSSLTLESPIRADYVAKNIVRVEGTPSDCVHLAITGLLDYEPDIVVSGINHGANLGDDVIYSGTVAAAIEGRTLGLPAIAVSLVGHTGKHFDTAAWVTYRVLQSLRDYPIPSDSILNINVPDVPRAQLKGIHATRLGNRHKAEPVIKQVDPRGKPIYWVGPAGPEQDAGPGTDFYAVNQGYASVTPLQIDLTRHQAIASLGEWLKEI